MPTPPRKDGKTQLGVWLSPDERKTLARTLESLGRKTFADLARLLIAAGEWPESHVEALKTLINTRDQALKDGRNEVVLVRVTPGEFQALAKVAAEDSEPMEEVVQGLVTARLGGGEEQPSGGANASPASAGSTIIPSTPTTHESARLYREILQRLDEAAASAAGAAAGDGVRVGVDDLARKKLHQRLDEFLDVV
ncbi:hypothetical protein [Roseimicrobium sp. ORNL1]|uniref:hypothetical protein n=1 Tax=Roseimicrobium sp. ORNL1 TaxID=2711231 RepID=UPI0013E16C36|nr:hypothetical protein [Roseimicrobium sp. ORNL1]QIF03712.1 hypothetical protein G5S37_20035 [Roseimicrobium sp. ORNL1]